MIDSLVLAFLGHMVGDYLFQNDWMALNKKNDSWICAIHALVWTLSVCMFAQFDGYQFFALFIFHYFQDHTNFIPWYMKTVGQEKFMTGSCSPWSIIVVDNVFHLLQIYLVWRFL